MLYSLCTSSRNWGGSLTFSPLSQLEASIVLALLAFSPSTTKGFYFTSTTTKNKKKGKRQKDLGSSAPRKDEGKKGGGGESSANVPTSFEGFLRRC